MVTFLEILSGPQMGLKYQLEAGLQIGRTKGHVLIEDPKVSGLHAQVEIDERGQLFLNDLNSVNGIYINGLQLRRIALLPGTSFEIGRTLFKVVQMDTEEVLVSPMTWQEALRQLVSKMAPAPTEDRPKIQVFTNPLRLTFVQGIQTDKSLVLSYGPRSFGANSLDVELLDPEAPSLAFEIHPLPGGALFKNLAPKSVSLNKQIIQSENLNDGDMISVGNSQILVSYI
jgi:hypothetical protein